MNMKEVIAAGLHFVSCLSPLKGQPTICHVRLIFSLLFMCVLPRHAMGPYSGRLDFICHPMINDFHKQLCFSHYSAEMSPLMGPYFFVLVTACLLFVLWTTMIQYSYLHLQKSRRVKVFSEKECLCHGFWNMILFHLGSEAAVLSVILGIFCYTQKIYFPETYNCTVMIAEVITCRDQHHWVKSIFNIVFIGGMASILLLCIATVCQAVCNKEKFIKELLILSNTVCGADDDGKHHRNTHSHSEQKGEIPEMPRWKMLRHKMRRLGMQNLATQEIEMPKREILAPFNTKTDLPDTDSLRQQTFYTSPNLTGTFISDCEFRSPLDDDVKRHRNTQSHSEQKVARVSDEIFQVIVNDSIIREDFIASFGFSRFWPFRHHRLIIVRVISEWIEDICGVMNSGELEERDKMLDVLEQLPLSEVFDQRITGKAVMHRKRHTDIAQDRDESFQVSVSRRIVAILDKWMEEIFSVMNSEELEERGTILNELELLSLSEVLDQWITERAVMHRKHNTDIAQDRDQSFQVSVSRRIVAIVVKWMEEIFRVMYCGKVEERDKIFDVLEQWPQTKVFEQRITERAMMHRKRNTDIAQDRDGSFEVGVRRRIVAIVARWLRQIFMLIYRRVEERDKILDMLELLSLGEVLDQRITERERIEETLFLGGGKKTRLRFCSQSP